MYLKLPREWIHIFIRHQYQQVSCSTCKAGWTICKVFLYNTKTTNQRKRMLNLRNRLGSFRSLELVEEIILMRPTTIKSCKCNVNTLQLSKNFKIYFKRFIKRFVVRECKHSFEISFAQRKKSFIQKLIKIYGENKWYSI